MVSVELGLTSHELAGGRNAEYYREGHNHNERDEADFWEHCFHGVLGNNPEGLSGGFL